MSLNKIMKTWNTLAFRLTLGYAGIFILSSLAIFVIFYALTTSTIQRRMDQHLINEVKEFTSMFALKGIEEVKCQMVLEAESEGVDKIFFHLANKKGEKIASTNMSSWENIEISGTVLARINDGEDPVFQTLSVPGRKFEVRIIYGLIGPEIILQIGESLEENALMSELFRELFATTIALIMIISALVGWFMARRALSGVDEVTRTALEISKGAFDRRVKVKAKGEEIKQLSNAFNRMLDRINELVTGMKEMTDNIAHDLKTPITRIRGLAELELNVGKSSDGCRDLAADTIEECDYILQMINTMLEISETEAGLAEYTKKEVNISEVIRGAYELFRPIAKNKGISLIKKVPDNAFVTGDMNGLQRMIVNILENAIKYTSFGGTVTISLHSDKGQTVITINDTGIGISEEDLPHIFKRLYRCDSSRAQSGFGLGLTLAVAVVHAHGGEIAAESTPGKGSTFTVSLPQGTHSP
jgi:signal transduction histidine kinase